MILSCIVLIANEFKYVFSSNQIQIDVYLGNRVIYDTVKGSLTDIQELYAMACLERFGLAKRNGTAQPIAARITVKDQQAEVNTSDLELYSGMVCSLLYRAT